MKQLVQHIIIMNGRFQFGHAMRLAGPSQCGKTSTLCKLLASKEFFLIPIRQNVSFGLVVHVMKNLKEKFYKTIPSRSFYMNYRKI